MSFVFPVVGATEWSGGSYMDLSHRGRSHHAIDIYADAGAIIVAPIGGEVIGAGSSNIGGFWAQIRGVDGNTYYFAHMGEAAAVTKGDTIVGGTAIGIVGNSGSAQSTSPHLHFKVSRNGNAVNPTNMLQDAVLIPDIDFIPNRDNRDIFAPASGGGWLPSEPEEDVPPAWIDQLNQARQDRLNNPGQEPPQKVRAAEIVRGTLRGMAQMVRSQGFETTMPEGIDGDQNIVDREGSR